MIHLFLDVGFRTAHYLNFLELHAYISGLNDKNVTLELNLPVINMLGLDEKSGEIISNQAEMGIFLSQMPEEELPKPVDKKVRIY